MTENQLCPECKKAFLEWKGSNSIWCPYCGAEWSEVIRCAGCNRPFDGAPVTYMSGSPYCLVCAFELNEIADKEAMVENPPREGWKYAH